MFNQKNLKIHAWNERWDLLIPGDETATLNVCIHHFIFVCQEAIKKHGSFFVALSGGNTPKTIYEHLTSPPYSQRIEWEKVFIFWGDERSVPPDHPESNFKMAMEAGFEKMPIPKDQIFRMKAEKNIQENALEYEKTLGKVLKDRPFDLVMLGMGEDGHTGSLFPQTEGLKVKNRLVIANFVPQKNTWRMTLTLEAINSAAHIAIYVLGAGKKYTLLKVFTSKEKLYPIQEVGTPKNKALWIVDEAASSELIQLKS